MDAIAVVALTVLGGAMRLDGISHPGRFVFDEFYAADACLYVLGPQPLCQTTREVSFVHPPLAKWLIGAGIWLFGFNSAGWRVAPLVAGTLSVALLYILARRILDSTFAACLAAGLLTFDLLHFVMSRTAMLDSFVVFFGLALFLGLQLDRERRLRQGQQDESLIRYVLTQPPDRVSYRMLTPQDDEMQRIADMALEAGILERRLDVKGLVDRQFIPPDIAPARIDLPRRE